MWVVKSNSGFTIIEFIATLAIVTALSAIAFFNFNDYEAPSQSGASALMGFLKQGRAKALATTRAYTLAPYSTTRVTATYGSTGSSTTQTTDSLLILDLPSGAYLTDTSWSICYGTRGLSNDSADIEVTDGGSSETVQVVLGGGVRTL